MAAGGLECDQMSSLTHNCLIPVNKVEMWEFIELLNSGAASRVSAAAAYCARERERRRGVTGRRKITVGVRGKEKRRQTEIVGQN